MRDKPDIISAQILININQNQHARHKDSEQKISPLRNGVLRKLRRKHKQINQQHDSRKKQRKDQEINIHFLITSDYIDFTPILPEL